MSALPAEYPSRGRDVSAIELPRGLLASHIRYLSLASRIAYVSVLAALDETGNALLADDEALAAISGLSVARWRRALADLTMREKVEIVDRITDDAGRVIHPGWIEIPWYTAQLDAAAEKRDRRAGAGRRSGEARRQGEARSPLRTATAALDPAPTDDEIDALYGDEPANNAPEKGPDLVNNVHRLPLSRERELVNQEGIKDQPPPAPEPVRGALADGWSVPDDWRTAAAQAREAAGLPGVNVAAEAAKFVQHHLDKGTSSRNWRAAFTKWVLGAKATLDAAANGPGTTTTANNAPENAGPKSNIAPVPDPYAGLIDPTEWTAWFKDCRIEVADHGVTVSTPTAFIRQRIDTVYRDTLARAHGGAAIDVV